jgi:hypothetical protein
MKLLLASFAFMLLSSHSNTATNVFICDSKASKAYHSSKSCRAVKNCTHEVLEITLKEATDTYKRVACKICY